MSTETLTRFRCDAPHCHTDGIGSDSITPPDGWTVLKSTAHIPATKTSPYPARRNRSRTLSYSERCYGSFSLHLCPEHPDAFADHQPRTHGYGYNSNVGISCSCGAQLGRAPAATMVGCYPSHAPESAWFHHLPAELRWYLWRDERQWATRSVSWGVERVTQHPTEERAREFGIKFSDSVVYRDAENDPWTTAPTTAKEARS